ncbi:MAG: hypothetical protein L6406_06735 [Desulfobacterales bacterium]|nr:hypothetical protein [Desulfobacterales bacterium]
MKLIEEIIEMLSSDSPNLNNALFKTKVLLHKLGEKELVSWVDAELSGYPNIESLPDYRVLPVTVLGNFSNMAYSYSEQPLPLIHLDKKLRKNLEKTHLTQSIAVLESYAKDESSLTITIAPELYPSLSKGLASGFNVERAWGKHSAGSMLQVINEVRSRLLDFVLQLSEKIPDEVDTEKMKEMSKEVGTSDLFRNAVFGNNATVIVGDSNIQNIENTITKNDFASLAEELRKHSVQEEDISSLKKAIDADKDAPELCDKKLGQNVRGWVSNMLTKATDAVWNINLGVAGGLLTEALKAYYGWF